MVQPILSDESIKQRVIDELIWDPAVDSTNVSVQVNNGVVKLMGTVHSYAAKYAAEGAARRVLGVKDVVDDINVAIPSQLGRSDADITAAAYNALSWDTLVPSDRITVSVNDGWVTLTGNVDWQYQKEAAENDVRNLLGVKGITNLITVAAPQVSPSEIKNRIEDAFKRSAEIDVNRVRVDTRDSTVVLTGTVDSWAERQAAENAAWSAKGVTDVDNQLVVAP